MSNKCSISKGKLLRFSFFSVKLRSDLGNDYRPSSQTRGKGPEDPSVTLGFQTQWPDASRSSFYIFLHLVFSFQPLKRTVFTKP